MTYQVRDPTPSACGRNAPDGRELMIRARARAFDRVAASRADYDRLGAGACVALGDEASTAKCTTRNFTTEAMCRHKCDWLEACVGYAWRANVANGAPFASFGPPCRC
jgi:hypothetical protein